MKIIKKDSGLLKKVSKTLDTEKEICDGIKLADKMIEFIDSLEYNTTVGLSAIQVGKPVAVFVFKLFDFWEIVVNPEILARKGNIVNSEEGCLSNPGIYGIVPRNSKIKVKYLNKDGQETYRTLKQRNSIIFQHEYDHLKGICCWDKFRNGDKNDI